MAAPSCSWIRPSCPRRPAPGWATPFRSPARDGAGAGAGAAGRQAGARRCRRLAGLVRADAARRPGATVVAGPDPCLLPKACKNPVEQQGTRDAHRARRGGGVPLPALARRRRPARRRNRDVGGRTAAGAAAAGRGFRGESFPAISGAGEHGAIIHYRVTEESNRPIQPERGLSDRFRRAVSRRHDGHHPHGLDRPRRAAARSCANG